MQALYIVSEAQSIPGCIYLRRRRLLAFDELYAVAVGVFHEEEAGTATHGVWFALEVYAAGLFEFIREGVEVFDGEGYVTVAVSQLVGPVLVVV